MNTVLSLLTVGALAAACAGYGLVFLSLCGGDRHFRGALERSAYGFTIGFGIVGWLLFFPGIFGAFQTATFWAVTIPGVALLGVVAFKSVWRLRRPSFTWIEIILIGVLAIVLGLDFIEALAPPADADTLAYHFAHPRDFLNQERIVFIWRAVDGAIPLLIHLTYAAALAIGGELALTFWVMTTGWLPALLIYVLTRPYISRPWCLALAVVFLTTPAVLYGGGNGQVEIRCASFVLASVGLLIAARRAGGNYRLLILSGVAAGFFVGAKYYGLIFAGAAGLFTLHGRKWLSQGVVFGSAVLVAGSQWYLWNWLHTGDPVFPVLTNIFQFSDTAYWTQDFGRYFDELMTRAEAPLDRTIVNWALYPFYSIFDLVKVLEGGRTGLGMFCLLILPLAVAGFCKREFRQVQYIVPLCAALIFFTIWFFSGTGQRTRHLAPVYPLILVGMFPVTVLVARRTALVLPLVTAVAITIAIQLGGQAIFSMNYARHVLSDETRSEFYLRNVPGANTVQWINRELPLGSKIGFVNRQHAYLFERPAYTMHQHIQVLIDIRATASDDRDFVAQMRRQGLTHIVLAGDWQGPAPTIANQSPFFDMVFRLVLSGCLDRVQSLKTISIASRTLYGIGGATSASRDTIFELVPTQCP